MRVLIVEDEQKIAQALVGILQKEGFVCDTAHRGEDAIEIGKLYDYEIILLDLMLPDIDGYEVMRRLRSARIDTPILILSGRNDPVGKVKGLGIGADDYVTKPFHRSELVARIRAIVRRTHGHSGSVIRVGRLAVTIGSNLAEVDGQQVHLTPKEYAILELLSLRKGTTLTKEMFLNHLYAGIDEPDERVIDVFISKLRKKLAAASGGQNYIRTVWGLGYALQNPQEAENEGEDAEMLDTPHTKK